MDTPSLSPTSVRLADRIVDVLKQHRALRTEQVIAAFPEEQPATVRSTISRLGRRGRISSPSFGVWMAESTPRATRPPHPRAEIVLPGSTSDELQAWAENVTEANPISMGIPPFRPSGHLTLSDRPFMGVELTFATGDKPVFTLAIFADIPTNEEREIMQDSTEAVSS
ncbi:hypothetical protein SEA_KELCOLE_71 [Microbacterium phage Kelcole]|nr:hypothetical protein SEA_KELCOLE_71 [Microbacterium phage Kelcole]